jgi:hypothetical protein
MGEVKKVSMEESEKLVGGCVVLWRQESKQAARVESVNKDDKTIVYELLSGSNKGEKYRSRYDSSQTVDLYDQDSEILALVQA